MFEGMWVVEGQSEAGGVTSETGAVQRGLNAHGHCSNGCRHVGDRIIQAVGSLENKVKSIVSPRCMDHGNI